MADYVDVMGGGNNIGTREIMPRTAYTLAATGTTFNKLLSTGGARVTRYLLECPNMVGDGTTTLSFIDGNSITVFTGSAHAENTNYSVPVDLKLVGTYTVRLTLSAAASTATTGYLTLYGY